MSRSPRPTLARRTLLGAGALAGLGAVLTACSTGDTSDSGTSGSSGSGGSDAGGTAAYPRTITHAFGETELTAQPQRVATISWVNPDNVLALGVVPVGMDAVTFGGNENKSTDWIDAKLAELGGDKPAQYSATDGLDLEGIAASTPDVIIAAYSGLTQEQYDSLAKIAPTIAYPKDAVAWGTPWQDSLTLTADALGKEDEAKTVIADVEKAISDYAEQHPELEGTTFLYGTIDPSAADQIGLYTDVDNRPRFMEQLGMANAPIVKENQQEGEFLLTWSPERADELQSDIVVSWFADEASLNATKADPLLSQIPAIKADRLVAQIDQQQVLSISASSALSLPWALEEVVPPIAEAAAAAKGQ
ncbi:iron-siderophore ABC transporter substrate-binding protein [Brachybacterium huguangmaarense]